MEQLPGSSMLIRNSEEPALDNANDDGDIVTKITHVVEKITAEKDTLTDQLNAKHSALVELQREHEELKINCSQLRAFLRTFSWEIMQWMQTLWLKMLEGGKLEKGLPGKKNDDQMEGEASVNNKCSTFIRLIEDEVVLEDDQFQKEFTDIFRLLSASSTTSVNELLKNNESRVKMVRDLKQFFATLNSRKRKHSKIDGTRTLLSPEESDVSNEGKLPIVKSTKFHQDTAAAISNVPQNPTTFSACSTSSKSTTGHPQDTEPNRNNNTMMVHTMQASIKIPSQEKLMASELIVKARPEGMVAQRNPAILSLLARKVAIETHKNMNLSRPSTSYELQRKQAQSQANVLRITSKTSDEDSDIEVIDPPSSAQTKDPIQDVTMVTVKTEWDNSVITGWHHRRDVTKMPQFYCRCGIRFPSREKLAPHVAFWKGGYKSLFKIKSSSFATRLHPKSKTSVVASLAAKHFACDICSSRFHRVSQVTVHKQRVHGVVEKGRKIGCTLCGYVAFNSSEFVRHRIATHAANNRKK